MDFKSEVGRAVRWLLLKLILVGVALAGPAAAAGDPQATGQQARAALAQGQAHKEQQRYEDALAALEQAAQLARQAGDAVLLDQILEQQRIAAGLLGSQRLQEKRVDQAIALFQKALAISRERNQRPDEQYDLMSVGYALRVAGKNREAMASYEQALALASELALPDRKWKILVALVELAEGMEHLPALVRYAQQAVAHADKRGDADGVLWAGRRLITAWTEIRPLWELSADFGRMGAAAKTKADTAAQFQMIFTYLEFLSNAGLAGEVKAVLDTQITDALVASTTEGPVLQARRQGLLARIDDMLGDFLAAERRHQATLAAWRKVGDLAAVGHAQIKLGEHFRLAGQYAAALEQCHAALATMKQADTWLGQGYAWLCQARVLAELGKRDDADRAAGEAAKLGKGVGSKALMAASLSAAASGARRPVAPGTVLQGEARERFRAAQSASLSASNRAMQLYGDMNDGLAMGREAAAAAPLLLALGEKGGYRGLVDLELQGARRFGDRQGEAVALRLLAELAVAEGQPAVAQSKAAEALAIAEEVGDGENAARIWDVLARSASSTGQRAAAIFLRKQAVATVQALRRGAAVLSRDLLAAQTRAKEGLYRDLAGDLLRQGRLAEAEQVLAMLKEQEFKAFVRERGGADARAMRIDASPAELPWLQRYEAVRGKLASLGQQLRAVQPSSVLPAGQVRALFAGLLPADAAARAEALQPQVAQARTEFQQYLSELAQAGPQLAAAERPRPGLLQQKLPALGPATAALYYVVRDDQLHIVLVTAKGYVHREVEVSAEALAQQIDQFRAVLQKPGRDPLPAAHALHARLIAPVAADLQAAGAKTLLLALDAGLRYVPFAALHDGKQFLVERHAVATYHAAAGDSIDRTPRKNWTIAALGVSEAAHGLPALPGVPAELNEIVKQPGKNYGILPGKALLDAAFTREALVAALRAQPAVLHLASHFAFDANGTEAESFLLLGRGAKLSLAEFVAGEFNLSNLDLLTLSACQTGVGSTGRDGVEVEGFAMLAQRKGAAAVLATLWPVADASTSLFMREFYRRREGEHLAKAAAVREIQLGFLRGEYVPGQGAASTRGAEQLGGEAAAAPLAHPFYWAPFVVMGNGL
ncbi:MAG: CHAT domain-containing protein [Deltaproteobacteria bacterium]|nr:CHAT domain-containing protein [Deltaproteobacteria bacterium]